MPFTYHHNRLFSEDVNVADLAQRFGTPLYVYSLGAIKEALARYQQAFSRLQPMLCYAVKANSNLTILSELAKAGCGFDIVSGGELFRVARAGGDPQKTIFSGVGKSDAEITEALKHNILCFNIESLHEIDQIADIAASLGKIAPVSLRINPDIDAKTHPYISTGLKNNKFGISYHDAKDAYLYAARKNSLKIIGLDCHIGSQLLDLSPLMAAAEKIFALADTLKEAGIPLTHIDLGGGIGIPYAADEKVPDYQSYADFLAPYFAARPELRLILEPGRSLIGPAGILLTRVQSIKKQNEKNFIIVDAAMNDLPRPALYHAYHEIVPVALNPEKSAVSGDIVGPICESGDFLGENRKLAVSAGDLLAVKNCGAYTASMASRYNSRPFIAEVLVAGDTATLIRRRETNADMITQELPLKPLS